MKNLKTYNQLFEKKEAEIIRLLEKNDKEGIIKYFNDGGDPNQELKSRFNDTHNLLFFCIMIDFYDKSGSEKQFEIFKMLVEDYGVDINYQFHNDKHNSNSTPLTVSVYWNKFEIFKYLLSLNAKQSYDKYTPNILSAIIRSKIGIRIGNKMDYINELKNHKILNLNGVNSDGESALHMISKLYEDYSYNSDMAKGYIDILYSIIDFNIDWNNRDDEDKTFINYLPKHIVEMVKNKYPIKYKEWEKKNTINKFKI